MKSIITGGSGFIGSHLVEALLDLGHEVLVIDRVAGTKTSLNAKAKYLALDIRDKAVEAAFLEFRPDYLFHLAAHIDDRQSVKEPFMNAEENIIGSLNVFEAARKSGVKKVLFASTGVVYGGVKAEMFTERLAPEPLTPYAISKYAAELYLHFYENTYHLPYVALRLANVYGPRQDSSKECGAIAIFTSKLLKGEEVFINNDGLTVRDYIHVHDVVKAFVLAVNSDKTGVFNCSTGHGTTTKELYELVHSRVVPDKMLEPKFRPEVKDELKRTVLDSSLLTQVINWQPEISLATGLTDTIKWYQAQV